MRKPWPYIVIWLLFTVSLAVWWLIHGLRQIERMANMSPDVTAHLLREQRMLHGEGATLIVLLILGGVALLYLSLREQKRNSNVKEFFATMTHELKTPLASLRIQVESLQEDLAGSEHAKIIDRLVKDSARLELQLENALYLASLREADQLHLESLPVDQTLRVLKQHWPEIEITINGDCNVKADTRAFEAILKNLIQNARVHGQARRIKLSVKPEGRDHVRVSVEDDGLGFKGDAKRLGELFTRHTPVSGSGVGLYLARKLAEQMNGHLEFEFAATTGFKAHLILKGAAA